MNTFPQPTFYPGSSSAQNHLRHCTLRSFVPWAPHRETPWAPNTPQRSATLQAQTPLSLWRCPRDTRDCPPLSPKTPHTAFRDPLNPMTTHTAFTKTPQTQIPQISETSQPQAPHTALTENPPSPRQPIQWLLNLPANKTLHKGASAGLWALTGPSQATAAPHWGALRQQGDKGKMVAPSEGPACCQHPVNFN